MVPSSMTKEQTMSPLRARMIEDMKLAGLAATTQEIAPQAVRALAKHYNRSPELLAEEEVRRYLLDVRERNARGSFKTSHYGIQFFYRNTLGQAWALFKKKTGFKEWGGRVFPRLGKRARRDRVGPCPPTSAAGLRAPPWARARPVPCCPCRRRAGRHWSCRCGDGKSSGLADPQAAAVNQPEPAAVYRIADRGENAPHFGMGKRLRQPPLLGKPDLFLNSAQSWPSVFR